MLQVSSLLGGNDIVGSPTCVEPVPILTVSTNLGTFSFLGFLKKAVRILMNS